MGLLHAAYHRPSTVAYQWVEWAGWILTLASIALVVLELVLDPSLGSSTAFLRADQVLVSLFALDLVLRVASAFPTELHVYSGSPAYRLYAHVSARVRLLFSPLVLIDLITVLSFIPALRALRALRLLRLARGVRFFRFADPVRGLFRAFEESWLLYSATFGFLLSAVVIGGVSLYLLERGANPGIATLADGLWWALVTITTVGFGDITPRTTLGRAVGVVVMVSGMFTLALAAGVVSVTFLGVVTRLREEQFRMSDHTNHVVVLGYDSGASMLLDALLQELGAADKEIVLMGQGERPSSLRSEFSWVPGDPTKEVELAKAKISAADTVLVVAPRAAMPQAADARTLMIVFTVRAFLSQREGPRRKRPVYLVAEILDGENVAHARTAGADEVIETTRLGFSMMAHAVRAKGTARILSQVASAGALSMYIGRAAVQAKIYREATDELREAHDITVIGVRTANKVELGPEPRTPVGPETEWVYLASSARLGEGG